MLDSPQKRLCNITSAAKCPHPSSPLAAPSRIIERESAFSRFLDLPMELQIQLWEEATKVTFNEERLKSPQFGVDFGFTYALMRPRFNRLLMSPGGSPTLIIPCFGRIMGMCRFAGLVACQWWKWLFAGCSSSTWDH